MNALNVLCAQLTRDLFAIAKLLLLHRVGYLAVVLGLDATQPARCHPRT